MKKLSVIVLLAALAAAGCGPAQEPEQELRLYVFDCGKMRMQSVQPFGIGDDETDVRELVATCYMIEHPAGRLLWDGGLPSALAETEGWQPLGQGAQARLDRTLAEQLSDLDLDLGSFNFVAFSHMHFDHVGVANELESGTLIIQQAEHDAAFRDPVDVFGFDPNLYAGLSELDQLIIDGDHDVFGDGRVRIISAPGHTPGHQALFVDLAETGPVVLSGDLYHFRISREEQRIPIFNFDADRTVESMERVEALVEETGAEFWIQHELAHFETQKKAPEFYR